MNHEFEVRNNRGTVKWSHNHGTKIGVPKPKKIGSYSQPSNDHCRSCGKPSNHLMGNNECMRCYQSYAHDTPPEGRKMKTFREFREDIAESHRFLTIADARAAYAEGVRDGTIGKCPKCGSPNVGDLIAPDFESRKCADCGKVSDQWRIPVNEEEQECFKCLHGCSHEWQAPVRKKVDDPEPHCPRCGKQGYYVGYTMDEDEGGAPTNNAGSGNIAGIGVGVQGEPGVSPMYQRKRKQLKLMNGPAVDPRMFADKIFKHSALDKNPTT